MTRFLQAQESKRLVKSLDEVWRVTPESVKVRAFCDPHRDRYLPHSVFLFVAHKFKLSFGIRRNCAIRSDSRSNSSENAEVLVLSVQLFTIYLQSVETWKFKNHSLSSGLESRHAYRKERTMQASISRNRPMPKILPAVLICLVVAGGTSVAQTTPQPTKAAAQSDAQKAFEKMKTLMGSWQGTMAGKSITFTVRLTSSGNTILHEANSGSPPPDHEITTFYVDGDRLLATHYCDGGNRVRWEGKVSPDGKTFEFTFVDVAGGTQRGFVKRTVFTMIDANKQVVELTYITPDGKPLEVRGEFQRTK